MNIKKSEFESALVLLGEVKGELKTIGETHSNQISALFEAVGDVKNAIGALPCSVHGMQIEQILEWKKAQNNNRKTINAEIRRGRITLRNSIIITLIGFACSAAGSGITLLVQHIISNGGI